MPAELPNMNDMLKEYLQRRSTAHASGAASHEAGDVELYDAVPAQVLDPKQAWDEATAVLAHFGEKSSTKLPADWPQLVASLDAAIALPMAAGHFPQSVRDLHRLSRSVPPAELPAESGSPIEIDGIENWLRGIEKNSSGMEALLAVGVLRSVRQVARAEKLLAKIEKSLPANLKSASSNEKAALMWCRGSRADALKLWNSLSDSAPVLFNRGVAALFLGDKATAKTALTAAVAQIDEASGWHHLGRLYLALAQS